MSMREWASELAMRRAEQCLRKAETARLMGNKAAALKWLRKSRQWSRVEERVSGEKADDDRA